MIKCPHCGGEMNFKVDTQKVTCPYCKSEFEPAKIDSKVKTSKKKDNPLSATGKSYTCSQCGATLMTFDDTAITFCSYCGSQAMLDDVVVEKLSPDLVIPFAKTKEECIAEYKNVLLDAFSSKFKRFLRSGNGITLYIRDAFQRLGYGNATVTVSVGLDNGIHLGVISQKGMHCIHI